MSIGNETAGQALTHQAKSKYGILLVDDSEDDRLFLRRAFRNDPHFAVIGEVVDGEDAISYLSGMDQFGDRGRFPFPDVLLLDLKMPRRSGYDVLHWLQTQSFKELLVIVVSGSILPQDAAQSLALGAAGYLEKSVLIEHPGRLLAEIQKRLPALAKTD